MTEQASLELSEEEPLTDPDFTMAFQALPLPSLDQSIALHFPDDLSFSDDALMADLRDFDFTFDDLLLTSEFDNFPTENGSDLPFPVPDSGATISPLDSDNSSSGLDFCNSSNARVSNSDPAASSEGSPDSGHVHNREIAGDFDGSDTDPANSPDSYKVPIQSDEKRDFMGFEKTMNDNSRGRRLKRKKERNDPIANPINNLISSVTDSSCVFSVGNCELEKKNARLMRNRESAQLSRQRKKRYVEELEEKVKTMHSTIVELNSKVSFFMAENAGLRQQLGGFSANPSLYPQVPMVPLHYPWVPVNPAAGFSSGSQVPLVPIPRLRPSSQPAPAMKSNKKPSKAGETEQNKRIRKMKKVASVTFLGLFLFLSVFLGLMSFRNTSGLEFVSGGVKGKSEGEVFTIREPSVHSSGSEQFPLPGNASMPLVASLHVPRNEKLERIDGNLIIHSVLASEKARGSLQGKSEKGNVPLDKEGLNNGLAIPGNTFLALASLKMGNNVEMYSQLYRSLSDQQRALASGSRDGYGDNSKSASVDGSLQQWFLEGVTGPMFSSSMCTEVFQFEVSSAIGPTTRIANVSADRPVNDSARSCQVKNRRILYPAPIPLNGTALHGTDSTRYTGKPMENNEFQGNNSISKSMVVSVMVDPREAGDGMDGEEKVVPKSLFRIFVVVLLDSVKYVTYSCMIPLKGSGSHLVTT